VTDERAFLSQRCSHDPKKSEATGPCRLRKSKDRDQQSRAGDHILRTVMLGLPRRQVQPSTFVRRVSPPSIQGQRIEFNHRVRPSHRN